MKNWVLWICFCLLIVIHTLDMELTGYYIGNDWEKESFPIMQKCIKYYGINIALWISRGTVYSLLYVYLINNKNQYWQKLLFLCTILYWTAMTQWLFSLGILDWVGIEATLPQWFQCTI